MNILVDADACPVVIKEILFRAAERTETQVTLIANQFLKVPRSRFICALQVPSGFDVADNEILKRANTGDLVITNDIPLADELLKKGVHALSPRGDVFTKETIKERLNIRDFMDTLRSSGIQTGGPSTMSDRDKRFFADQLDKWLTKNRTGP